MPSQLAYPEKITRLDRANVWRWRLAEAQAANDSARYSSRSAQTWGDSESGVGIKGRI